MRADYAFTATVIDVSTDPDEEAAARGDVGSYWAVELRVTRPYRGDVPARITWTGHTNPSYTCNNDVLGERLTAGDRLFVAIEDQFELKEPQPYGRALLWRSEGNGWSFYSEALADDSEIDAGPYPRAARAATSTRDILAAISVSMPDTASAQMSRSPTSSHSLTPLAFLCIATFLWVALGTARRGMARRQRG